MLQCVIAVCCCSVLLQCDKIDDVVLIKSDGDMGWLRSVGSIEL